MSRPELRGNIVRPPDEDDMNDPDSSQCAEDGTHGQVIAHPKLPGLYPLPQKTDRHDGDGDPTENPHDDECDVILIEHDGELALIEEADKGMV